MWNGGGGSIYRRNTSLTVEPPATARDDGAPENMLPYESLKRKALNATFTSIL